MRRQWTLTLVAALSLTGCGRNEGPPSGGGSPGGKAFAFTIPVEVGRVQRSDIAATAELIGNVRARARAQLGAETIGRVVEVRCLEGDRFKAGDVLVRLCDRDARIGLARAQAALAKAQRVLEDVRKQTRPEVIAQLKAGVEEKQALLAQAEDDLARVESLVKEKVRTEAELKHARLSEVAAQAALARAKAQLAEGEAGRTREEIAVADAEVAQRKVDVVAAEGEMAKTQVKAPFDGVVLQRLVDVGAHVNVGNGLVEVAAIDELDVFLELPERYISQVQVGTKVSLFVDSLPKWSYEGRVDAIVPAADPKSRNVPLRLRVPNPDGRLFPGLFVRGEVVVEIRHNAVVVPVEAVTPRGKQQVVFVVEQGVVRMVPVQLGLVGRGLAEVGSAVVPGAAVVTVGGEQLFPGAPVRVAQESAASTVSAKVAQ